MTLAYFIARNTQHPPSLRSCCAHAGRVYRALRAQVEAVDAEAAPAGAAADDAEAEAPERARKRPRLSQGLRCGGRPRTLAVLPAVCHATHLCHALQVRPTHLRP